MASSGSLDIFSKWLNKAAPLFNVPAYQLDKGYELNKKEGPMPPEPALGPFFDQHGTWRELPEPAGLVSFLGFQLYSEIGVAAGPLLDSAWIKRYADLGYSILSYKTVRTKQYDSHCWPNIVYLHASGYISPDSIPARLIASYDAPRTGQVTITNSFGIPSVSPDGAHGWMRDVELAKSYLSSGQVLVVSVVGTPIEGMSLEELAEDFALCASLAVDAGADMVEANLSCPNIDGDEGSLYDDPTAAALVARTVKERIPSVPLALKLGYFEDQQLLRNVARVVSTYADVLVAINAVKRRVQTLSGEPILGYARQESGVCGYAIRQLGIHNVQELCRLREEEDLTYKVIGCGGVFSPEDVRAYLSVGADAVETATGALWHPLLAMEWNASKYGEVI